MFSMTINNNIVVYFTFVLTTVNYKNDPLRIRAFKFTPYLIINLI